uniref:GDP-mannose 4,6-dehydratase n=1 Tax=viral metagenome TaxID=1070528 RepID=A0A6C0C254_9ZZZZ
MVKVAFLTGITGQDGSYLAEFLLKKNYRVYGIVRRTSLLYSSTRIDHIRDKLTLKYGDMTDGAGLSNYIHEIIRANFDVRENEIRDSTFEIYNLAAQSHVKVSFEIPEYTADTDGMGVMRLLEIIRTLPENIKSIVKFYQAGTSELYGEVLETPQSETTPFNPVSPYAAAKLYAFNMTKIYRKAYDLFAVNGILFNHESPRRGRQFLTMKVVNAVKEITQGKRDFVQLGNLNSQRDWGHANDYVKGMWLMLQRKEPKDYVLATGKTWTVRDFVQLAFAHKGYDLTWEGTGVNEMAMDQDGIIRVMVNPKYYRPCEVELLLGDATKAEKELEWRREFDTLEKLIVDMFN